MKIQQTLFQSIDLLNAEKYAAHKSMTAVQPHTVNYAAGTRAVPVAVLGSGLSTRCNERYPVSDYEWK